MDRRGDAVRNGAERRGDAVRNGAERRGDAAMPSRDGGREPVAAGQVKAAGSVGRGRYVDTCRTLTFKYLMRRDYFDLAVEHVDWVREDGEPRKPVVRIDFHGPEGLLRDRLTDVDGAILDAGETDVAFRLQEPFDDPDATGVVGVTNRVTGDFVLELNEEAADVLRFIHAAREYGQRADDEGRYRVEITVDGEELVTYDKRTFLVYDAEGNLLRSESLIPSGVEL